MLNQESTVTNMVVPMIPILGAVSVPDSPKKLSSAGYDIGSLRKRLDHQNKNLEMRHKAQLELYKQNIELRTFAEAMVICNRELSTSAKEQLTNCYRQLEDVQQERDSLSDTLKQQDLEQVHELYSTSLLRMEESADIFFSTSKNILRAAFSQFKLEIMQRVHFQRIITLCRSKQEKKVLLRCLSSWVLFVRKNVGVKRFVQKKGMAQIQCYWRHWMIYGAVEKHYKASQWKFCLPVVLCQWKMYITEYRWNTVCQNKIDLFQHRAKLRESFSMWRRLYQHNNWHLLQWNHAAMHRKCSIAELLHIGHIWKHWRLLTKSSKDCFDLLARRCSVGIPFKQWKNVAMALRFHEQHLLNMFFIMNRRCRRIIANERKGRLLAVNFKSSRAKHIAFDKLRWYVSVKYCRHAQMFSSGNFQASEGFHLVRRKNLRICVKHPELLHAIRIWMYAWRNKVRLWQAMSRKAIRWSDRRSMVKYMRALRTRPRERREREHTISEGDCYWIQCRLKRCLRHWNAWCCHRKKLHDVMMNGSRVDVDRSYSKTIDILGSSMDKGFRETAASSRVNAAFLSESSDSLLASVSVLFNRWQEKAKRRCEIIHLQKNVMESVENRRLSTVFKQWHVLCWRNSLKKNETLVKTVGLLTIENSEQQKKISQMTEMLKKQEKTADLISIERDLLKSDKVGLVNTIHKQKLLEQDWKLEQSRNKVASLQLQKKVIKLKAQLALAKESSHANLLDSLIQELDLRVPLSSSEMNGSAVIDPVCTADAKIVFAEDDSDVVVMVPTSTNDAATSSFSEVSVLQSPDMEEAADSKPSENRPTRSFFSESNPMSSVKKDENALLRCTRINGCFGGSFDFDGESFCEDDDLLFGLQEQDCLEPSSDYDERYSHIIPGSSSGDKGHRYRRFSSSSYSGSSSPEKRQAWREQEHQRRRCREETNELLQSMSLYPVQELFPSRRDEIEKYGDKDNNMTNGELVDEVGGKSYGSNSCDHLEGSSHFSPVDFSVYASSSGIMESIDISCDDTHNDEKNLTFPLLTADEDAIIGVANNNMHLATPAYAFDHSSTGGRAPFMDVGISSSHVVTVDDIVGAQKFPHNISTSTCTSLSSYHTGDSYFNHSDSSVLPSSAHLNHFDGCADIDPEVSEVDRSSTSTFKSIIESEVFVDGAVLNDTQREVDVVVDISGIIDVEINKMTSSKSDGEVAEDSNPASSSLEQHVDVSSNQCTPMKRVQSKEEKKSELYAKLLRRRSSNNEHGDGGGAKSNKDINGHNAATESAQEQTGQVEITKLTGDLSNQQEVKNVSPKRRDPVFAAEPVMDMSYFLSKLSTEEDSGTVPSSSQLTTEDSDLRYTSNVVMDSLFNQHQQNTPHPGGVVNKELVDLEQTAVLDLITEKSIVSQHSRTSTSSVFSVSSEEGKSGSDSEESVYSASKWHASIPSRHSSEVEVNNRSDRRSTSAYSCRSRSSSNSSSDFSASIASSNASATVSTDSYYTAGGIYQANLLNEASPSTAKEVINHRRRRYQFTPSPISSASPTPPESPIPASLASTPVHQAPALLRSTLSAPANFAESLPVATLVASPVSSAYSPRRNSISMLPVASAQTTPVGTPSRRRNSFTTSVPSSPQISPTVAVAQISPTVIPVATVTPPSARKRFSFTHAIQPINDSSLNG